MAKAASKVRGKFADERYTGPEPTLNDSSSLSEEAALYNWYNYYFSNEDAKGFALTYLKSIKFDSKKLKKLASCRADDLRAIGWLCRCLSQGGTLPTRLDQSLWSRIEKLCDATAEPIDVETKVQEAIDEAAESKNVISIQERIKEKTEALIADIEDLIDIYYTEGKTFDAVKWFRDNQVKPQLAQKIAEFYKPLYSEVYDALQGKDEQLVEAYAHWKKPKLKAYLEFIRELIGAAEQRCVVAKAIRKPRKKKAKPATAVVSKVQFMEHDPELDIRSVKATDILGAQQLWVFNVKYRTLAVYNAMGPAGLAVKGTTLTGFDEKISIVKKLRKPKEQLHALANSGKVQLRKFMDGIKCKPKEANGRLNRDTILLRVIK